MSHPMLIPATQSVPMASKSSGVSKKRLRKFVADGLLKCVRYSKHKNATMFIVMADLLRLIDELAEAAA